MTEQEVLALVRRIKHDFANNLQVISGYMQMQNYAKAQNYLNNMAQEMMEETYLFNALQAGPALYFFRQMISARELGIKLNYKNLTDENVELLKQHHEPWKSLCTLREEHKQEALALDLSIRVDENGKKIYLVFTSPAGQELKRVRL